MANKCVNVLIVTATRGQKEKLNEFIEKFSVGPNDEPDDETGCGDVFCDKPVPVPDELPTDDSLLSLKEKNRLIRKFGYSSSKEFLDLNDENVINCDFLSKCPSPQGNVLNGIRYQFETDWVPPLDYFEAVQEMWPGLNFKLGYCEPACSIIGFAETLRIEKDIWFVDNPM